eukprot:scaffold77604_cov56-Phaeocystis_antarctica.AAC.3
MYTISWSAVCSSTLAPLASSAPTCAVSARAAPCAAAASSGGSSLLVAGTRDIEGSRAVSTPPLWAAGAPRGGR